MTSVIWFLQAWMNRALVLVLVLLMAAALSPRSVNAADELVINVRADANARFGVSARDRLAEALEKARSLRAQNPNAVIVIALEAGVYRLARAVRIAARDAGRAGAPLVIRGADRDRTVLTGAEPLRRLKPIPAKAQRRLRDTVPATARPNVQAYRLPAWAAAVERIDVPRRLLQDREPITAPMELFDAKGALVPARWPNAGFAQGSAAGERAKSFRISGRNAQETAGRDAGAWRRRAQGVANERWSREPDLWAHGYFRYNYAIENVPVVWRDGALVPKLRPSQGFAKTFRVRIEHALADLDAVGEWYRDQVSGSVFAWPRASDNRVEMSRAEHIFLVSGAAHVRFENMTLQRSRGDALRVVDSRQIELRRCVVRETGARAAAFYESTASGVRNCAIDATGGGIHLSGGDRTTLARAGLFALDNRIERYSRVGPNNASAVTLDGVGQIASGNFIRDGHHMAMLFSGNDHVIEFNEITNVSYASTDMGVIYTGRDWTAAGTRIERNYFHDIRLNPALVGKGEPIKGVYLDDLASGMTVRENVFVRVDFPVFLGGGRYNRVVRNVFVDAGPSIHLDGRGLTWAKGSVQNPDSEIRRAYAAVPVRSPPWRRRYPWLATLLDDRPEAPKANVAVGNLMIGPDQPYRIEGPLPAGAHDFQDVGQVDHTAKRRADHKRIKTAASIRILLAAQLQSAGLETLPLERMDRDARVAPPPPVAR